MENVLKSRKRNRLRDHDYSAGGAYFITICTKDRRCILSRVVGDADPYKLDDLTLYLNAETVHKQSFRRRFVAKRLLRPYNQG